MPLKTIREEPDVTLAIQRAGYIYPRVWDAYEALQWVLVHSEPFGATLAGVNNLYRLHKQAAGPPGVPSITVIYTVTEDVILLHAIKVG